MEDSQDKSIKTTGAVTVASIGLAVCLLAFLSLFYSIWYFRESLKPSNFLAGMVFVLPVFLGILSLIPNLIAFFLTRKRSSRRVEMLELWCAICLTLTWVLFMTVDLGQKGTWQYTRDSYGLQKYLGLIFIDENSFERAVIDAGLFKLASPIIIVALANFGFYAFLSSSHQSKSATYNNENVR